MNTTLCVIGAGPSGLAAAKNGLEAGLSVVVFEQSDTVGGNWVFREEASHSSVYENTHLISSKAWSEYEDFPMPTDYPEYPHHRQMHDYFVAYAKHFGLWPHIQFSTTVEQVEPSKDGGFQVTVTRAGVKAGVKETHHFSHVMVANGHHWQPRHPEIAGNFSGHYMHSHDFKRVTDDWRGKRVLVIGAGNSACDVAVEASCIADCVHMSLRSPQWFIPKFLFGQPTDVLGSKMPRWLPRGLRQRLFTWLLKLMQGDYAKTYGLPRPTTSVLSHHPTINSEVLDFIRHGRIVPKPGVSQYVGESVEFVDGSAASYDIIVACTGFRTVFPFLSKELFDVEEAEKIPLYLRMMHPEHKQLYFVGLFQPLGCIWPLADYQAKLAVQEILGRYQRPEDMQAAIAEELANPHLPFESGTRHAAEVDYHAFRDDLKRALRTSGLDIGQPPAGRAGHYKDWSRSKNDLKAG
ncbi:MAG: NAD(P)-binding domain-containing protein [Idiomarina sp.]|nr:NAD(P)-binding domain-containing protein [Idiomarina sp.]